MTDNCGQFISSSNLLAIPVTAPRSIDMSLNLFYGGSLVETKTLKVLKTSHNSDASIASTPGRYIILFYLIISLPVYTRVLSTWRIRHNTTRQLTERLFEFRKLYALQARASELASSLVRTDWIFLEPAKVNVTKLNSVYRMSNGTVYTRTENGCPFRTQLELWNTWDDVESPLVSYKLGSEMLAFAQSESQ